MLHSWDAALTGAVNYLAGRTVGLDLLMIWVSRLGVPLLVLVVAAQWWRKRDRRHWRHILIAAGFSFAAGLALNQIVLLFLHRARPYDAGVTKLLIARSADFSFPSDHATATAAIAAAFLTHGARKAGLWFLAAALLMAFSRVYVGTHYVGDVLGGAATGVFAAALVRELYREGARLDRLLTDFL